MRTLKLFTSLILTFALNVLSIPLDSVLTRGDSCLTVVWMPDSTNTRQSWYTRWSAQCTATADTVYRHCDFKPGVSYRGVAYSYGGRDQYASFRTRLPLGPAVGSHSCHYSSYIAANLNIYDSVAGTDCSAFVCYMWNVPRVATGSLIQNYSSITKSQLAPGDILVSTSHTVLIAEVMDSTHYLVWEASPTYHGCRQRTINRTDSAWSAYVARRNPAIAAALPPVAGRLQLSRASDVFTIKALQEGKAVSIEFARPFTGTLEIRTTTGKTVLIMKLAAAREPREYSFEKSLASGIYISTLNGESWPRETGVAFMVAR